MRKLIQGIVEFHENRQQSYREQFGHLASRQSPDALMVACSDSRVAPNVFASTNPGDLFVVRNVGNMIPASGKGGLSTGDQSELAAIEFAVLNLKVKDIIICGHSNCGAMQALHRGRESLDIPHLKEWLVNGEEALRRVRTEKGTRADVNDVDRLSQMNAITQVENLTTYPIVKDRVQSGELRLHAWWFEIGKADVYAYDNGRREFVLIDAAYASTLLRDLK